MGSGKWEALLQPVRGQACDTCTKCAHGASTPSAPFSNSVPLGWGGWGGVGWGGWGCPTTPPPPFGPPPPLKNWAKFSLGPSADQDFSLAPSALLSWDLRHLWCL